MIPKERRKTPRESLSPFGEMGLAHGAGVPTAGNAQAEPGLKSIGVFYEGGAGTLGDPYFGKLLAGIADAAERDQQAILICSSRQLDPGRQRGAIILCGRAPSPGRLKAWKALKLPLVLLEKNRKSKAAPLSRGRKAYSRLKRILKAGRD